MKLPNEFRINHRAASESLLRAAEADTGCEEVLYELGKASYFENEAMAFVQTPRQKALAKALKAKGFRFVGATTAYAGMQACGVVDDHVLECPTRARVEAARRA